MELFDETLSLHEPEVLKSTTLELQDTPETSNSVEHTPVDINEMIENISLNATINGAKQWKQILMHTNASSEKETDIYQC